MGPHTLSTQPQLRSAPLHYERCAREADILTVLLSGRASEFTVGSRKLGPRGLGSDEGAETEQEGKVSKIDILTEESLRMHYMLLGDPTGNTTAWSVDKVSS